MKGHGEGTHQHERRVDDTWRREVNARMDVLESQLAANTMLTQRVAANTDEIVQFFEAGKGFFRVVRWTGTAAKWVSSVAAAAVIVWALVKFGVSEAVHDVRGAGK